MTCNKYKNGNIIIILGIAGILIAGSCRHTADTSEKSSRQGIPVTVAPIRSGQMKTYLRLNATSAFLFKSVIKSPVTGFIDNVNINQGDEVGKNSLLFTVHTKEASAIAYDTLNNLRFSGIVSVKASAAGMIASIQHSKGDYIAEGDELCEVAIPGSLVFILDVPFELSPSVRLNAACEIALPDSQVLKGIIKSRFPSMMSNSQTERFIVRLAVPKSLPENLAARIRITRESVKAESLPKACILTDETMQSFWVMKLVNDSMAVKVPVTTGITEDAYVQIIRPVFDKSDLFLASGNYGLGDTAFVKVLKSAGHEQ